MESKGNSLGTSLLVPCVQELAKEPLVTVPERYIRSDLDHPIVAAGDDGTLPELPVIDMQRLHLQESMESELAKLHLACKEWGFFQVCSLTRSSSSSLIDAQFNLQEISLNLLYKKVPVALLYCCRKLCSTTM